MTPIIAVLMVLSTIGAGAFVVQQEIVPVELQMREPLNSEPISMYDIDIAEYEELVNQVPGMKGIQKEASISSSSIEEISDDYIYRLTNDGYCHKYTGMRTVKNVPLTYDGFVKGLTCVGIVYAPGGTFDPFDGQTVIVYTTGPIGNYHKAYDWFMNSDLDV